MYLKKLREQRSACVVKMQEILKGAKVEQRAMSEEEEKEFSKTEKEIEALDRSIQAAEKEAELQNTEKGNKTASSQPDAGIGEQRAADDEKTAFANYIRGVFSGEQRAESNMTFGENGAVIPKTIAGEIIKKVKEKRKIMC